MKEVISFSNLSEIMDGIVMPFTRPSSLSYPHIWHRFSSVRDNQTLTFVVQDLTEDMFDEALQLLATYFTRDEPPCKYIGINNHPTALAALKKLWADTLKDRLSIGCIVEGGGLVGVNALTVACADDEDNFETQDKVWAALFGAVDTVTKSVNVFEKYNVDKYLTAYGLTVHPEWRGLGIGKEILLARIPLCKALNIKLTATVFTAGASQVVAQKAGFETISEISYENLAKMGYVFPGIEKDTKSSKFMALVVD